jgi:hypothetical protein
MTLDLNSIYNALSDPTGQSSFIQRYSTKTGKNGTATLSQDRIIYATKNKFAKKSAIGTSMYQNALTELRAVIKFPRYRESIARKIANVFRHYTIDQEAFKNTPLGRTILNDEESERKYLLSIQNLIMEQEAKHSSIATFKWVESNEKTYGGQEPNLDVVEKQTINMLALRVGVPVNLMAYAENVNRSTLETIAEFFVQRRKNGPQKQYKNIIEKISNLCMQKWGYNGKIEIRFKPFVQENMTSVMDRVGLFNQRAPGVMSDTELRKELRQPEEVNYGKSDDQIQEHKLEQVQQMQELQQPTTEQQPNQANPNQPNKSKVKSEGNALPEEKAKYATEEQTNNGKQSTATSKKVTSNLSESKQTKLDEFKQYLLDRGVYMDVRT